MKQKPVPVKTACSCDVEPLQAPFLVQLWGTCIDVNRVLDSTPNYSVEQDFRTFYYASGFEIVTILIAVEERAKPHFERLINSSPVVAVHLGPVGSYVDVFAIDILPLLALKGVSCVS